MNRWIGRGREGWRKERCDEGGEDFLYKRKGEGIVSYTKERRKKRCDEERGWDCFLYNIEEEEGNM